jgi:hypothetical protein
MVNDVELVPKKFHYRIYKKDQLLHVIRVKSVFRKLQMVVYEQYFTLDVLKLVHISDTWQLLEDAICVSTCTGKQ